MLRRISPERLITLSQRYLGLRESQEDSFTLALTLIKQHDQSVPQFERKDNTELMEGTQQSENGREAEIIKIYGSEILEIIIFHFLMEIEKR